MAESEPVTPAAQTAAPDYFPARKMPEQTPLDKLVREAEELLAMDI